MISKVPSGLGGAAVVFFASLGLVNAPGADVFEGLPVIASERGYLSSKACQECHREEHASWFRTYHRTMSQPAVPENVKGDFGNFTIDSNGLKYRVFRKGPEFWAEMPDPDVMMYVVQGGRKFPLSKIPRIERQVVMLTGSHHYETYWVESPRYSRLLQTLPLVYLLEEKRWVPREAVFIKGPDDTERFVTQWNHHCIRCHSTAPNPGLDPKGMLRTRVAELGIACEACHGPGEKHVEFRKAEAYAGSERLAGFVAGADPIVNPKKLDAKRSAEVCGQCHGVYVMRDEFAMEFARQGELYRPGEDLHRTRYYIQYPSSNSPPGRLEDLRRNPRFFQERWWDDGTILAGGREYTALSASRCFQKGTLSCVSCHSMHRSNPADQLKNFTHENEQCTQCHRETKFNQALTSHTRHRENSSGSRCLNCHMPFTTYALLKGIRSHQISSPSVLSSARHGVPNACNLCHLDKTLEWTQRRLARDHGQAPASLSAEQKEIAASLLWILKGNAAQRAITAWHFGWEPAREASGTDWMAWPLARLLEDSYGVIRHIAGKSLRSLPRFEDFSFDFVAPGDVLKSKADEAIDRWRGRGSKPPDRPELLLGPGGALDIDRVARLIEQRDDRPMTIKE